MGLSDEQIIPVKADAEALPFEPDFFDAVVSTDSYNYFGRDPHYLDEKLLPFVKPGGWIYIAIPGMKRDCHDRLPSELEVCEMESNDEVWADWLRQENEYAVGDRKSMEAGAGKYLNFIKIVLQKKRIDALNAGAQEKRRLKKTDIAG